MSPTTAALWESDFLPPWAPFSMYFLALSQAPPALAIIRASSAPAPVAPARSPPSALGPKIPHQHRHDYRHEARDHHFPERGAGGDVDAVAPSGLGGAFEQSLDLAELAAHLLDHFAGSRPTAVMVRAAMINGIHCVTRWSRFDVTFGGFPGA